MTDRVPVYDSWGNYIGYFTEDRGCGGFEWILVLLLIVPLVAVFYFVNVFRIGKRLIQKGEKRKAVLWFGMFLYAPIFFALFFSLTLGLMYSVNLAQGVPLAELNNPALYDGGIWEICAAPIFCSVLSVPAVYLVHLFLCFKYSDLDF